MLAATQASHMLTSCQYLMSYKVKYEDMHGLANMNRKDQNLYHLQQPKSELQKGNLCVIGIPICQGLFHCSI